MALKQGTTYPRDLTVLLIGTENTGKSSLISTFLGEKFIEKRPATDGAEQQICKAYAKGWKKITKEEKTVQLYSQFIGAIQENAKDLKDQHTPPMPAMTKPEGDSPSAKPGNSLATSASSFVHVSSIPNLPQSKEKIT